MKFWVVFHGGVGWCCGKGCGMDERMNRRPKFSQVDAGTIAEKLYGLQVDVKELPSDRDQNFLLTCRTGARYVLKIANREEERDVLELQNQVMTRLAMQAPFCPQLVAAPSGDVIMQVEAENGDKHFVRLIHYLPGSPMALARRQTAGLLQDLGGCIARMTNALDGFDHPGAHRYFEWDLANGLEVIEKYRAGLQDVDLIRQIEVLLPSIQNTTRDLLDNLPKSVIHNDVNDYNVLVGGDGDDLYCRNQRVTGIIDFGDIVFSYTVGDLAIGIAYCVLDKPDPLSTAVEMVKGYHQHRPLDETELAALFSLVCLRLCVSACMAARQIRQEPDNAYLSISQAPIRNTLPKLSGIHPRFAQAAFRNALGWSGRAKTRMLCDWLTSQEPGPVLDVQLDRDNPLVLDLGVASIACPVDLGVETEKHLTPVIFERMRRHHAQVAIGRYDEARLLYQSPLFAKDYPYAMDHRTIHMGVDLYARVATRVLAPLSGKVYASALKPEPYDYGCMLILEHQSPKNGRFFTLYGHLDPASIRNLEPDEPIEKGQVIAVLGAVESNGGWTPHLHFQLVTDLLDLDCDFPGVVSAVERQVWKEFSPDPNAILQLPADKLTARLPEQPATLKKRRERLGPSVRLSYRDPIKIVRGHRQYLFDQNARRYLDAFNNVPHVGHCHPKVIEAARVQMSILNTNTRYLSDVVNRYAEELCKTFPEPLEVCFLVNSASEGNELALRLARNYTAQRDVIVLDAAYHGHTSSLIDMSPYKHAGPGGRGAPDWVHVAPLADDYRGPFRRFDPQAGEKYAGLVADIIENISRQGRRPAAFIAESCPSVGGQLFFPPGYLAQVYASVREAGGLCIADEVQTGFGRIGSHFYAFEEQGVVPDIVVLGKPIGNGHPISAVITRADIARAFDNGMEFFSTFGGNTVSCAVGLAVLEVVIEENLQTHAADVGDCIREGFEDLFRKYPIVGDVRGRGLFWGLELVRDRHSLEPADRETALVVDLMRERGILIGTDGPYHNVIKIRPPMPFSRQNAVQLIAELDEILDQEFGS